MSRMLILQPWQKFVNPSSLSLPVSLSESTTRITQNLTLFLPNYFLLLLLIFLLTLFTRPLPFLFFLFLLASSFYLFSTRPEEPFTLYVVGALSVLTLVGVFWCNLFVAFLVGGFLVILHAVFMMPQEEDDTQQYGSLLNNPVEGGYTSV